MGAFFIYILKSAVCLVLFYLFFKLLLSRETFHRFNRVALLGVLLLSLLIPCIEVTTRHQVEVQQAVLSIEQLLMMAEMENAVPAEVETGEWQQAPDSVSLSWIQIVLLVYLTGIVVLVCRNVYSLLCLIRLICSGRREKQERGITLVVHDQAIAPFSWMKYIVISRKDLEENGREILIHETAHIRNRHSIDLLIADVCIFFQWFNPGAWLLKQELQNIHEYEADETVINEGVNAKEYQLLLIKKAVGTRLYSMANGFDHSKLKNRIGMMLKKRSNGWVRLRMLLAVPVAAGVVYAFAQPEMSEKQVLLQMELMTQDALLQDSIAESKLTEEIASMKQFFKEKSDAWWKHHRTPEGRYVWRTTQTHRLYMNGSNEVMFDTVVYKILTDPRQVIAGRLRSAREADRLEKKKDEPRFLYMVYDVNSDKRQVLGMLKEIKLAFDDLRAEYVAKGASDVDEVCPYMVYVYGPRKYGVNGAELLIGAAGAEPQERIHDITGNRLKSYQGRYGKNASVLLRVDNSVSERGYIEMCKRVKRYFPAAKTEHEK